MLNELKVGVGGTVLLGVAGVRAWQFSSGEAQFQVVVPDGRSIEVTAAGKVLSPAASSGPHLKSAARASI